MISIIHWQTLHTTVALAAAAVCFGCTPTPASPAGPTPGVPSPGASSTTPSVSPRIVGTVLSSSGNPQTPPKGGAVVYLEDAPRQPDVAMTAAIDVHYKEFTPFISVITTGGTVTFGNKDALTHHVFSPDLPKWDTGYLQKNDTVGKRFDSPGAIALLCNIHPEMIGYVLVIPSTYFAKVGADGKYTLANAPPGTYKVTAWAPRMQTVTQSVTVTATGPATANFELHPAGKTD